MSHRCPCCDYVALTLPTEIETFKYVEAQAPRRVSSAEVAEQFGLTLSAANNRLRHLFDIRWLDRAREALEIGGIVYLYGVAPGLPQYEVL